MQIDISLGHCFLCIICFGNYVILYLFTAIFYHYLLLYSPVIILAVVNENIRIIEFKRQEFKIDDGEIEICFFKNVYKLPKYILKFLKILITANANLDLLIIRIPNIYRIVYKLFISGIIHFKLTIYKNCTFV